MLVQNIAANDCNCIYLAMSIMKYFTVNMLLHAAKCNSEYYSIFWYKIQLEYLIICGSLMALMLS